LLPEVARKKRKLHARVNLPGWRDITGGVAGAARDLVKDLATNERRWCAKLLGSGDETGITHDPREVLLRQTQFRQGALVAHVWSDRGIDGEVSAESGG
jgi:hypothetical protein